MCICMLLATKQMSFCELLFLQTTYEWHYWELSCTYSLCTFCSWWMIAINIIGLIFQVECIEYCCFYHIFVATTNNKGYQHVSTTEINMTCFNSFTFQWKSEMIHVKLDLPTENNKIDILNEMISLHSTNCSS